MMMKIEDAGLNSENRYGLFSILCFPSSTLHRHQLIIQQLEKSVVQQAEKWPQFEGA